MNDKCLIATEVMMFTNGTSYGSKVWLGDWDSSENWHTITKEEYMTIMSNEDPEEEGI